MQGLQIAKWPADQLFPIKLEMYGYLSIVLKFPYIYFFTIFNKEKITIIDNSTPIWLMLSRFRKGLCLLFVSLQRYGFLLCYIFTLTVL